MLDNSLYSCVLFLTILIIFDINEISINGIRRANDAIFAARLLTLNAKKISNIKPKKINMPMLYVQNNILFLISR